MRNSVINNNFTAGELTPLMYGRPELEPFQKGLSDCTNMRVLRHGGVTRREGTRYVGEVKDSTKAVRLIPFIFSEEDSVMLEVGAGYIRFWETTGLIHGSSEEITNGTFDTSVANWTDASSSPASMTWDGIFKRMKLWSNGNNEAKGRQTVTGLSAATEYQLKFHVDYTDYGSTTTAECRIGSSLGGAEYGTVAFVSGSGAWHSKTFTTTGTTVYVEFVYHTTSLSNYAYPDDVSLKATSSILEVVTSYTEAELFEVMYAQSNDVMWLTHRNHEPLMLSRVSASSFTIADAEIKQGPLAPFNDSSSTMTITGVYTIGGASQVTSSTSEFVSADTGTYLTLYSTTDLTKYAVLKLTYSSPSICNCVNITAIPSELQAIATTLWAWQAIGHRYGYPTAVAFHDQRLIYAGTDTHPQSVYGSTVADFETFSVGPEDDDHYSYLLASTKRNEINFLAVKHDLIAGTLSNEWGIRGGGLEDPITPSNVLARAYKSHGSIRIMAEEIGGVVVFAQRAGHKIIGLTYDMNSRSLESADLLLLAEHLTIASKIRQMSYQNERDSTLWVVTDTGQLLGMTHDAAQDILAWHKHTTEAAGLFESVATVPVVTADQTWVLVNREIDGSNVRYIETVDEKDWREDDDPYYVDCGITYSGAATDTITGLDHLEGETVEAYASGEFIGEYTVASGSITLDRDVTYCHVGLGYISKFTEMPEASNSQDGSAHTRRKRKAKVDLRLYKTQGIKVNGDVRNLPRDPSATKPELFTGIIESNNLGWDLEAKNTVESIGPNPLTVLAIRSTLLTGQE